MDGVDLVSDIHASVPQAKLLVTSRETLNLYEEWFHPMAGLVVPVIPEEVSGQDAMDEAWRQRAKASDAVQLFAQSARRAQMGFDLDAELESVVHICQLVDGVPLALELSASWLKVLSCQDIADEIASSLDILTTQQRNIPTRHRSMRAVLEQSWALLDAEEQRVFQRLTLFHNGFDAAAAQFVAATSLMTLASLADKSFIRLEENRYQIHELLSQFAAKTIDSDNDLSDIRLRHSQHYLGLIDKQAPAMFGPTSASIVAQLRAELDNIRHAWQTAIDYQRVEAINQVMDLLAELYHFLGLANEGVAIFSAAAQHIENQIQATARDGSPDILCLICRLLTHTAIFARHSSSAESVEDLKQRAIDLGQQCDTPLSRAAVAYMLCHEGIYTDQIEQSIAAGQEALTLYREHGTWRQVTSTLHLLGEYLGRNKNVEAALAVLQEARSLSEQKQDLRGQAIANSHIGVVHFYAEELSQSRGYFVQAIQLFEQLNDIGRASVTTNNLAWVQLFLEI